MVKSVFNFFSKRKRSAMPPVFHSMHWSPSLVTLEGGWEQSANRKARMCYAQSVLAGEGAAQRHFACK